MKKCIWCNRPNSDTAEEHIIPEALGCPPEFIFTDGTVCKKCNNKMAHLDRAVINDFDIPVFQAGVRRKRNRPPTIHSRGNFTAGHSANEKFMSINMGSTVVKDPLDREVVPFENADRHINARFLKSGNIGEVSFEVKFATSKKFRRGIYKIALSSLAYFLGRRKVLENDFNSIREFVVKGKGDRVIFLRGTEDKIFKNQVWSPYVNENGYYSLIMRLAHVEIATDLSPNQSIAPIIMEKSKEMYDENEWTYMPKNT